MNTITAEIAKTVFYSTQEDIKETLRSFFENVALLHKDTIQKTAVLFSDLVTNTKMNNSEKEFKIHCFLSELTGQNLDWINGQEMVVFPKTRRLLDSKTGKYFPELLVSNEKEASRITDTFLKAFNIFKYLDKQELLSFLSSHKAKETAQENNKDKKEALTLFISTFAQHVSKIKIASRTSLQPQVVQQTQGREPRS